GPSARTCTASRPRTLPLGLCVDVHLGNLGALLADPLLDRAGGGVRGLKLGVRVEGEGQERDETAVRLEEAQLARRSAGLVADDAQDRGLLALRRAGRRSMAFGDVRKWLEVRPDDCDLGDRGEDRGLNVLGGVVSVVEGELAGQLEVERDLRPAAD